MLRLLLAGLLWFAAIPASAAPAICSLSSPDGAKIELTSAFNRPPASGFLAVRCAMDNPGTKTARWVVTRKSYRYGNMSAYEDSYEVVCAPGESRMETLMVPAGAPGQDVDDFYAVNNISLQVTRSGSSTTTNGYLGGSDFSSGNGRVSILAGSKVGMPQDKAVQGDLLPAELVAAQAPGDWRAYSGFSGIVLSDEDWSDLPPAAKNAVLSWVRLGGQLFFLAPERTGRGIGLPEPDPGGEPDRLGMGRIVIVEPPGDERSAYDVLPSALGDVKKNSIVLGAVDGSLRASWEKAASGLFARKDSAAVRWLLIGVLVLFAVAMGPVNFFLIAPAAKRHRLFLSVPVISLAASLVLVAFIVLGDGVGGEGTRFVLVENRAGGDAMANHIVQSQVSRCGVVLRTGFSSPATTTIMPVKSAARRGEGGSGAFSLRLVRADGTAGLEARGAWFASRASQAYCLTAIEPTRGRLEKRGGAESRELVSSLDYPARAVWLHATDGTWWKAGELRAGSTVRLEPSNEAEMVRALDEMFRGAPEVQVRMARSLARRKGSFTALTDSPPSVETHESVRWTTRGVVTGLVAASGAGVPDAP